MGVRASGSGHWQRYRFPGLPARYFSVTSQMRSDSVQAARSRALGNHCARPRGPSLGRTSRRKKAVAVSIQNRAIRGVSVASSRLRLWSRARPCSIFFENVATASSALRQRASSRASARLAKRDIQKLWKQDRSWSNHVHADRANVFSDEQHIRPPLL